MAVRYDGGIYVETGFSRSGAERLGRGDLSSCDDGGRDPARMYFADAPKRVVVWSYRGHDPARVLGVRARNGVFRVLVAEGLPTGVRRDVHRRLLERDRR